MAKSKDFFMIKILLIDNYDSFTYNLVQILGKQKNVSVEVIRNDEISIEELSKKEFDCLVISPGPKKPKDARLSNLAIKEFYRKKPILGVCLGMQCINEFFQGETIKADYPMHGKSSEIINLKGEIFQEIPENTDVARYHSLRIKINSSDIFVSAELKNKVPMAIQHKEFPIFGLQFHPESFMTEFGEKMIINFLNTIY